VFERRQIERAADRGPQPLLAEHPQRDPAVVAGPEHPVARGTERPLGRVDVRGATVGADPPGDDVGHGNVDPFAFTGARPPRPRRSDEYRTHRAALEIGNGKPGDLGIPVATVARRKRSADRLEVDIVPGRGSQGPVLAVARERAVDD
jgi:hypothetical protein